MQTVRQTRRDRPNLPGPCFLEQILDASGYNEFTSVTGKLPENNRVVPWIHHTHIIMPHRAIHFILPGHLVADLADRELSRFYRRFFHLDRHI